MEGLFALVKHRKRFLFIYLATLFLSLHYFTTVYVNSSLLSLYASASFISLLYVIGSLINIVGFVFFTPLLRAFGNAKLLILLSLLEFSAVLGLAFVQTPSLVLALFIFHQALPPLILFTLDIFLENTPHRESKTGGLRGVFLTVTNLALVLAPLIIAGTVKDTNFSYTYLVAALFLIPLLIIAVTSLSKSHEPHYQPLHIKKTVRTFLEDKNLKGVFIANLLLQLFYAWMVVYTPLYLRDIGLSWQEIGLVFTFMLLPFVLFELPIGRLSDSRFGEKEFMIAGFITLSFSVALMSFITAPSLIMWAILLFLTRTGASFIEITTESYFFKKVHAKDSGLISVFRMTRPLSFIIGPIIGALVLLVFDLNYAFVVFGVLLALGIPASRMIKDTL
mgnify:CR=1 FL=1